MLLPVLPAYSLWAGMSVVEARYSILFRQTLEECWEELEGKHVCFHVTLTKHVRLIRCVFDTLHI